MSPTSHEADLRISRSITVAAPAATIFAILTDPRRHHETDGSGTVRRAVDGPERLTMGSRFGMSMRLGLPYRVHNTVVEFEPDRLIAWRHFGGHRWRYELTAKADGTTLVTETFDGTHVRGGRAGAALLRAIRAPRRNAVAIEGTLARLKQLVE
jgi:uncharacterized protein YndB with AHSA1/START domain